MITQSQKLQAICGREIKLNTLNKLSVKQYQLGEILDIGYDLYNYYTTIVLTKVKEMLDQLKDTDIYMDLYMKRYELTKLDMVLIFCQFDDLYAQLFKESLEFTLDIKGKLIIELDSMRILVQFDDDDVEVITDSVLKEIMEIVEYLHSMGADEEHDDENPYDENAKQILDRLRENREKVKALKAGTNDGNAEAQQLANVISVLTAKSNTINKLNVVELTIFQIYNELKRLYKIDNYNISIKAMMGGAKDVELEHWDSVI